MFSGIITDCLSCLRVHQNNSLLRVSFSRLENFQTISEGDSVCVDGVCLTVESLNEKEMTFALGPETLKITGWDKNTFQNKKFNLEKAMCFGQPVGGHFVTGHVDGVGKISECSKEGESTLLTVDFPEEFKSFFWRKGYIALNGVSLTINEVVGHSVKFCLIPKTLEKTNLLALKIGDKVNFEVDYFSRFFVHGFKYLKENLKKSK